MVAYGISERERERERVVVINPNLPARQYYDVMRSILEILTMLLPIAVDVKPLSLSIAYSGVHNFMEILSLTAMNARPASSGCKNRA